MAMTWSVFLICDETDCEHVGDSYCAVGRETTILSTEANEDDARVEARRYLREHPDAWVQVAAADGAGYDVACD